ncbi:MAG TPA: OmpA family protein [Geobacteraceae bacterium]
MRKMLLLVMVMVAVLPLSGCLVAESTYLKKVEEADALTRNLADLQKRYDNLTTENNALKETVERLNSEVSALTTDKNKLVAEKKELDGDLKASKSEALQRISDLRQKIGDLESENARLKQDIVSLQKAKEEKVQEVSKTYEQLLDKMKGEIAQGQVTISELKGKLTVNMVNAILFDSGKAEVKPDGLVVLQKVVDILKGVKDKAVRVEGHTDNVQIVGDLTKRYPTNWELSAARAINVTRFLQGQGLDPLNLGAVAYGEYKPVASNDTDEGKAKNRRIEIILVPKE